MPRYLKLLIWLITGISLLFAVVILIIATMNWNWAKPWVNRQLSELSHRQVQIDGNLNVDWQRPTELDGWRSLFPWPMIHAEMVTVGNPPWAQSGTIMVQAKDVRARVNPYALDGRVVRLADLEIKEGQLVLERRTDGTNNWTFGPDDPEKEKSGWEVVVDRLMLDNASVRMLDSSRELDVTMNASTSDAIDEKGYSTKWTATGKYHDVEVSGEGQLGQVLALRNSDDAFPVQGRVKVGSTAIAIEGTVNRPHKLAALDVNLELSGPTMADLYPLLGVVLPDTPPYKTAGHLMANFEGEQAVWTYENFSGTVGKSDLKGTLTYQFQDPRPVLSGNIESELLRFKDLGPLIGGPAVKDVASNAKPLGKGQPKPKNGRITKESAEPPANKALPVAKADTNIWKAMDAQVSFAGKRIISNTDLPLDDVKGQVVLSNGLLKLQPLDFGVAGGTVKSTITLDGTKDTIHARVDTQMRGLRLDKLFPAVKSMDAALGTVSGDAQLSGRGNSVSALLAHADGDVRAVVSKGTVSQLLLETAGLNVANIVFVKLFGDEQVMLQCLVAELRVDDGLIQTRTVILETDDAVVTVDGQINLATETMDLDVHPDNKSLRIFTLRSPLYVRGTFQNPDVGVQKGPLAVRAGAAVALGVIATPLAALLPLLNVGTDDTTTCLAVERQGKNSVPAPDKKKGPKGSITITEPTQPTQPMEP